MDELKHFNRIEAYMDGTMNVSEKEVFETELKTNSELKKEYDAYQATLNVIKLLAFEQLDNSLKTITLDKKEDPHLNPTRPPKINEKKQIKNRLAIAATLLLLLTAGLVWYANSQYKNEALAEKHFIVPNLNALRSDTPSSLLSKAAGTFYKGQYPVTIQLLESLETTDVTYSEAQWLLGHAFLKNDQPAAAKQAFEIVLSSDKDQLKASARWHLILANLSLENHQAAEIILDELLQQPSGNYYVKAQVLKREIQSSWRKLIW